MTAVAEALGGQNQILRVGSLQVIGAGGELLRRGGLRQTGRVVEQVP